MSTSLKVVNIAVSFFTATNRRATVLRKELIFSRRTPRASLGPLETAEGAATDGAVAATGAPGTAF